jgi:hypothetical protein
MAQRALSEHTIANYKRILKHLNGGIDTNIMTFLNNTDAVLTRVKISETGGKTVSDNTQKSRLTCIMSTMTRIGMVGDAYDVYKTEFNRLKNAINNRLESGELSEKQEAAWLEKPELDELYAAVKKRAESADSTYRDRQDLLLLALYYKIPAQRNAEIFNMKLIIGNAPATPLSENSNYLYFDDKKMVINIHKNAAAKGVKKIDLNNNDKLKINYDEFFEALILYVAGLPNQRARAKAKYIISPLLRYENGTPWERSDMIREALNRITGKRIGAQMFRTMTTTQTTPASKTDMERAKKLAADMGHSMDMHIGTYTKARNTVA